MAVQNFTSISEYVHDHLRADGIFPRTPRLSMAPVVIRSGVGAELRWEQHALSAQGFEWYGARSADSAGGLRTNLLNNRDYRYSLLANCHLGVTAFDMAGGWRGTYPLYPAADLSLLAGLSVCDVRLSVRSTLRDSLFDVETTHECTEEGTMVLPFAQVRISRPLGSGFSINALLRYDHQRAPRELVAISSGYEPIGMYPPPSSLPLPPPRHYLLRSLGLQLRLTRSFGGRR